jgi:uncharacterized membrane protein YqiK
VRLKSPERQKSIDLVEATKQAQRQAIGVTVAAEAEKKASEDRAAALRIGAEGEADAEKLRAEAAAARYSVEAEGKRAINEAVNMMSPESMAMLIKQALIGALPDIIRESVKPMEQIDAIKILQVNGLSGAQGVPMNGVNGTAGASHGNGSLADEMVNSALRYRAQAPLVDSLMKEIGIDGSDINSITNGVTGSIMGSIDQPVRPIVQDGVTRTKPHATDGSANGIS